MQELTDTNTHMHADTLTHTLSRLLSSFEFSKGRQRNCQHQRTLRKSLRCTELLVPFTASINAGIRPWIAEVRFNLNNDFHSQCEQGTFLHVNPLNICPGDCSLEWQSSGENE